MTKRVKFQAMALWAAALGCGGDDPPVGPCDPAPNEVTLVAESATTLQRVSAAVVIIAAAEGDCGAVDASFTWSSSDPSVAGVNPIRLIYGNEVTIAPDQTWVQATGFGRAEIRAETGGASGTLTVDVVRPPTRAQGMTLLGGDSVPRITLDFWLHGDYAYSGTEVAPCGSNGVDCETLPGSLIVWRLGPDGMPHPADSVALPGPRSNDVKVSPDGRFLVASQEGNPADNGIVIMSLADPARPVQVAHYTDDLDNGVHNLWIERIDGTDYVFAAENGFGNDSGLHVIDVSNLAAPRTVARWRRGPSAVHDVYVRDGLAFVSHWNEGLVIVDVGNGLAGGRPDSPQEVGRVTTPRGNVHNAWYWPERELVFVGEEVFPQGTDTVTVGELRVVDVSDPRSPRIVSRYGVPGETPHNFWLDEANEILYAAWYDRGVRALDVSGSLPADLSSRELGYVMPSGARGLARIWAPQVHRGRVYLADSYHGIWVVEALR